MILLDIRKHIMPLNFEFSFFFWLHIICLMSSKGTWGYIYRPLVSNLKECVYCCENICVWHVLSQFH